MIFQRELTSFINKIDLRGVQRPTPVFTDNCAVASIADGDFSSMKRTKHCVRLSAFIKENCESKTVLIA